MSYMTSVPSRRQPLNGSRRTTCLVLILSCFLFLFSNDVARVGTLFIPQEELSEKIDELIDEGVTGNVRQIALGRLIDEYLLMNYADETGLSVTESEVEQAFIEEFGSHPKLQTNGQFDPEKFQQLKRTPQGSRILRGIKRELLLSAARSMILDRIEIDEDKFLENYIKENVEYEIGYVLIDGKKVNLPLDCTPDKAVKWFQENERFYMGGHQVTLDIYYVPIGTAPEGTYGEEDLLSVYQHYRDRYSFEEIRDSLTMLLSQRTGHSRAAAQRIATEAHNQLKRANTCQIAALRTDPISSADQLGSFEKRDLVFTRALEIRPGNVSEIIDIGSGFLFFRVGKKERVTEVHPERISERIWQDYLDYRQMQKNPEAYRDYYWTHIDSFRVPAALIERLILRPEHALNQSPEAITALQKTISDSVDNAVKTDRMLADFAHRHQLEYTETLIELENPLTTDPIDLRLASLIASDPEVPTGRHLYRDVIVFYRVRTLFPEYVRDFEEVRYQIAEQNLAGISEPEKEIDYQAFFEDIRESLRLKGKLSLGGAFFPFETYRGHIGGSEIAAYYREHMDRYRVPVSVSFDLVAISDPAGVRQEFARYITERLKLGMDLQTVRTLVGTGSDLLSGKPYPLSDLPAVVRDALDRVQPGQITEPVYYAGKWLCMKKMEDFNTGVLPIEQVRDDIVRSIAKERSQEQAVRKARTVLDSVNTFSRLQVFVDSTRIFKTPLQSVMMPFGPLQDIRLWENEFFRLWNGQKFDDLILTDNGCAVVFMLEKEAPEEVDFETALPLLRDIYEKESRTRRIKEYLAMLVKGLRDGQPPAHWFRFFGEWRRISDLNLDSPVPGVDAANITINQLLHGKREGDVSSAVPLGDDQYLIYRINKLVKPLRSDFNSRRHSMERQFRQEAYRRWLDTYREQTPIEIF